MNAPRPNTRQTCLAVAALLALGATPFQASRAATCIWNPASGSWNVAANWSCGVVPGSGDTASVAAGKTASTTYGSSQGPASLANAGVINIVDYSSLAIEGASANTGTINLGSAGNYADLRISGVASIGGGGSVTLGNQSNNRIISFGGAASLTTGSGQTIQGAGQLGAGSALALVNNGFVIANQSAGLIVDMTGGVTNNNVLRADGATLTIQGTAVNQGTSAALDARNGGIVRLSGAAITGGLLTSTGGGTIATTYGTTSSLAGVTNQGSLTLVDNSAVNLLGDLNNSGTMNLASAGNYTDLTVGGSRSITGSGAIILSNSFYNRIRVDTAVDALTIGSSQTLQGSGQLGSGGAGSITNAGTLIATQSVPLLINPAHLTNTGTLRADGGTLQLQSTIDSSGGAIEAKNGSKVQLLNGTVISNANFSASGAGSLITTVWGGTVTLSGGTVNGQFTVADNSALRLSGDLASSGGTITLGSIGNYVDMQVNGARALTGPLTVDLSNQAYNRILALNGSGDALTIAGNVTIQGAGQLGAGSNLAVVNNGTLIGNLTNGLTIRTAGSFVNNETIRADGTGSVVIAATTIDQTGGGALEAVNGRSIYLREATIVNGGTLSSSSGGAVSTQFGQTATLSGVTNQGIVNAVDNSTLQLAGALTNNGTLNAQSAGNYTDLLVTGGAVTIGGSGTVVFSNSAYNRLRAAAATDSLTLGNGQTLQGSGQIGAGGQFNFTNNGTVIANASAGLTIASTGTLVNQNIMRADGANLIITSAGTNIGQSTSGTIEAVNGGTVTLTGQASITGGTLATASGGAIQTGFGNISSISGLTNQGTFNVVDNSALYLSGTITNNGALNLNSAGNITDLRLGGNVTLAGTGTTTLSNAAANRIIAVNPGDTLTIGTGQTVQGAGAIGAYGGLNLVNQGTITANQATALTIAVAPTSTVVNAAGGLMQAVSGKTLNLMSAVQSNGTVAANGGFVNASAGFSGTGTALTSGSGVLTVGAASTVGTLTNNGSSAGALALGGNNITVSADHTNANWGSGNSFNRRANVSGSGQILAAGDVAQVITGANITGGNSANATLTINNVRVGSTTFNYQIGNAGSTGPTLRGAIQTAVNGGNLSDARLSGGGVTASNYNAGGPGGNSGNLAVVFNAASAGTLAPMSAQVLNLRSNFDNIADQKLNIVLGSGAAAYNAAVGSASTPITIANQRVNGSNTATVVIANTAAPGAFSEDLNATIASLSGQATATGSVSGRLAGTNNTGTGAINVGVDTGSAGAKTGVVTLNYQTAGAVGGVSNGLGVTGANGPQAVTVNGNVYQAASGAIQTAALNFGNVQVGDSVTRSLVIRNTATGPAGYVEDLNASFATGVGTDARITGSGSLSGILAGQNSSGANGTMTVSVNTAAAGAVNGSIRVNYATAGAVGGVSNGLGTAAAGFEDYAAAGTIVQGNVIDQAKPVINGVANPGAVTVNLGNVRVGGTASQALAVLNQASGNQQALLNASIASDGTPVTAAGSFSGLAAGNSSNALQVGIDTSVAGARSGSATVSLVSDITAYGNCAPNCTLNLPSQTVNVNASVFRLATGGASAVPVNLGAFRVGVDTPAAASVAVTNTAAADGYSEQLGIGSVSSGNALFTASNALGSGRVNAGASAAGAISVGAGAGLVAGINTGSVTVQFISDGTASGTGGSINSNSQQFNVSAKGYTPAVAQLNGPATIDFGTVRVGTAVGVQTLTISNAAAVTAANDTLKGTLAIAGAGFTGHGSSVAGLTAGGASGALQVGLDTSMAGVKSGSAQVSYLSQNPDMADLALGDSQSVALAGTVNALAQASFSKASGASSFSCSAGVCTLNFGTLMQGSGTHVDMLELANAASGPADDLLGSFDFTGFADFGSSGFGGVNLAAGDSLGGLSLSLDTSALGSFSSSFWFNGFSHNAFQSDYALNAIQFVINGVVVQGDGGNVPIPGTLALLLAAGLGGLVARRHGVQAHRDNAR